MVVLAAVVLLGGAAAFGAMRFADHRAEQDAPSAVTTTGPDFSTTEARVVFRNTAPGDGYGLVSTVPLSAPGGARTLGTVECDRIDATAQATLCLSIDRGLVTTFAATLFDERWRQVETWPLPGVPSRARFSPDGSTVAFSAFITGESYASVGFSIATQIWSSATSTAVNLEDFAFSVKGKPVTNPDRNFWGVSFSADPEIFYATAASSGQTWLVKGDLAARTLVAVRGNAECPSVSPDGTRVAYKTRPPDTSSGQWAVAVLDLASNRETVLAGPASVDDQVEWLDDSTLLYAVPRAGTPGDSDVWSLAADGSSDAEVLIEHAWSPAVVRP
jgi:Tol biopolymer transport system component